MLGPVLGGACAKWAGSAGAALDFGAAMILACPVILWGFNRIAAAVPRIGLMQSTFPQPALTPR